MDMTSRSTDSRSTTRSSPFRSTTRNSLLRRALPLSASGLLLAALLAGCTAAGSSDAAPPATIDESGAYTESGAVADGGAMSAPSTGAVSPVDSTPSDRRIVQNGSLAITADDPIAAADNAVATIEDAGGRIDSRAENPRTETSGPPSADLVARIPSTTLTTTLDALSELGDVERLQLSETDVTAQGSDLDARISALTASADRLTTLLSTAANTDDLLAIETTLSQRQSDLDSLTAQSRDLADQVAYATVSVSFGSLEVAPVDTPDTFASGFAAGFDALTGFGAALLVAAGIALPWAVVLAVLVGVVLLVLRRRANRSTAADGATMEG